MCRVRIDSVLHSASVWHAASEHGEQWQGGPHDGVHRVLLKRRLQSCIRITQGVRAALATP